MISAGYPLFAIDYRCRDCAGDIYNFCNSAAVSVSCSPCSCHHRLPLDLPALQTRRRYYTDTFTITIRYEFPVAERLFDCSQNHKRSAVTTDATRNRVRGYCVDRIILSFFARSAPLLFCHFSSLSFALSTGVSVSHNIVELRPLPICQRTGYPASPDNKRGNRDSDF